MLRPRTIRRARERRGAVSREWLQAIDASVIGDIIHQSKNDRVRGVTADFVTFDECDGPLIPWGRVNKTDPTLAWIAWNVARTLPLPPSREVVLSYIGAQC